MARKDYKVGDRVYYEVFGGGIGSGIIKKIENSYYINDWRKVRYFKYLWLDEMTTLEDYNALPYSDPRVKALQKQYQRADKIANELLNWLEHKGYNKDDISVREALNTVYHQYKFYQQNL